MFIAFIKNLPVGELPSHSHEATTNTTGEHTHNIIGAGSGLLYGIPNGGTYTSSNAGNHSHVVAVNNTGSNIPHNNMMPYINVYIWKRTN